MKAVLHSTSWVEPISLVNKQELYEKFKRPIEAIYSEQNADSKTEGEFFKNN
jgi:hypothetical protein